MIFIRFLGFKVSDFSRKVTEKELIEVGSVEEIENVQISWMSLSSVFAFHGGLPVNISRYVTPIAQISL